MKIKKDGIRIIMIVDLYVHFPCMVASLLPDGISTANEVWFTYPFSCYVTVALEAKAR